MSMDFSASICVGYRFKLEDVFEPFRVTVGENKFEDQDRFDPKSGKKTGTEKVQTEFSYSYLKWKKIRSFCEEEGDVDDGEEILDQEAFIDLVLEKNGMNCVVFGDGPSDDYEIVIFPKNHPEDIGEGRDWGKFCAEGHLDWGQVCEMGKDLLAVGKKLRDMGLEPGKPEIVLAATGA